jgi:hypothetical protein
MGIYGISYRCSVDIKLNEKGKKRFPQDLKGATRTCPNLLTRTWTYREEIKI